MKQIANFFTLYWIFYFPTCIAFYQRGAFEWVDEIMTVVLMAFTFMQYGRRKSTNVTPWKEYYQYFIIMAFFVIYGLLFGANVYKAVLRDMVQWIRPFSVIYCTWILNPRFNKKQVKMMTWSMLVTLFAWVVYHPEVAGTFGGKREVEFPVLGQLAMCTGMAWYIFHKDSRNNKFYTVAIVLLGMLAPKFKYLGEVVCVIGMLFFLKKQFNFKNANTWVLLGCMMAVAIFMTWSKFDFYYVSGANSSELARPMTYRIAFTKILWDYFPFGSGMGSWGCAAAADYYSPLLYKYHMNRVWGCTPDLPMFVADAFYPTLCQLGVVGIFFFCVFWKRRLKAINVIQDMRYYRVAWISFFCLAIEQMADTSFLSGKGMGYCMLLALCLNANRNMGLSDNGKVLDESREKKDEG